MECRIIEVSRGEHRSSRSRRQLLGARLRSGPNRPARYTSRPRPTTRVERAIRNQRDTDESNPRGHAARQRTRLEPSVGNRTGDDGEPGERRDPDESVAEAPCRRWRQRSRLPFVRLARDARHHGRLERCRWRRLAEIRHHRGEIVVHAVSFNEEDVPAMARRSRARARKRRVLTVPLVTPRALAISRTLMSWR